MFESFWAKVAKMEKMARPRETRGGHFLYVLVHFMYQCSKLAASVGFSKFDLALNIHLA